MSEVQMVRIGDYCNVSKGKIGIKKAVPGKYPLVTTAEDRSSHIECHFNKPSVIIPLVSSTGHGHASLKRIHYQEGAFAVGSILCAVTPIDANVIVANFLYHYLDVYKEKLLVSQMKGMANVTLSVDKIKNIKFPLLPIEKQSEWICLFEKAVSFTNGLTTELNHQQTLLKKLRQSILQDAISGKLTEQWRKKNPDVEPASELLKRIKAEKERLIKEQKIKKQKPLSLITKEEIPFELPRGWAWCRLGEAGLINPRNRIDDNLDVSFIPMKLISNLYGKIPDFEIRKWREVKSSFTHFQNNDVAIAKITPCFENSKSAIFLNLKNGFGAGTTELHIFRSISHELISNFIYIILKNSHFLKDGEKNMSGVCGQKRIPSNFVTDYIIPIPPFIEQKVIVSKVNSIFSICDHLKSQITKSQQDSKMLMQAVLKEAFEG